MKAQGSTIDLWDLVALNADVEARRADISRVNAEERSQSAGSNRSGKCSAFIATGTATKGGKIVIAHSNWSSYAEGERWSTVFDVEPSSGYRMLMDGLPVDDFQHGRFWRTLPA